MLMIWVDGITMHILASVAKWSKTSFVKIFMMFIALLLIPVSECTCFNTLKMYRD